MLDRIPSDTIRAVMQVAPITEKLRSRRLGWFGHVVRSPEDRLPGKSLNLQVAGKRPLGRPKMRWMDRVRADLRQLELTEEDPHDRQNWRSRIRSADPSQRN